jgi:hypothetical protein
MKESIQLAGGYSFVDLNHFARRCKSTARSIYEGSGWIIRVTLHTAQLRALAGSSFSLTPEVMKNKKAWWEIFEIIGMKLVFLCLLKIHVLLIRQFFNSKHLSLVGRLRQTINAYTWAFICNLRTVFFHTNIWTPSIALVKSRFHRKMWLCNLFKFMTICLTLFFVERLKQYHYH